ncbi:MAG: hypothetical protein ACLFQA_00175 [Bacteroidales bacterium]
MEITRITPMYEDVGGQGPEAWQYNGSSVEYKIECGAHIKGRVFVMDPSFENIRNEVQELINGEVILY